MRVLVLAVVIVFVAADVKHKVRKDLEDQWEEISKPAKIKCFKESEENKEVLLHMLQHEHYPNKPEFKRFLKCLAVKLNLVSEDGVFNEAAFRTTIKGVDLDIFEESVKSVEGEKDVLEKVYLFAITALPKVASRYPQQN